MKKSSCCSPSRADHERNSRGMSAYTCRLDLTSRVRVLTLQVRTEGAKWMRGFMSLPRERRGHSRHSSTRSTRWNVDCDERRGMKRRKRKKEDERMRRETKWERGRRASGQVAFGHLQNLLTPLARQKQFIFRTIYSVPRTVDSQIALSADSTIQFHDL